MVRDLVREVFAESDVDGGGALSCRELRQALRKLGLELTGAQAVAILRAVSYTHLTLPTNLRV